MLKKIGSNSFKTRHHDELHIRNDIIKTSVNFNDLEDMVFRKSLTYSEIEENLVVKHYDSDSKVFELTPRFFEIVEIVTNLPSFITISDHDNRKGTILSIEANAPILKFFEKSFFRKLFSHLRKWNLALVLLLIKDQLILVELKKNI